MDEVQDQGSPLELPGSRVWTPEQREFVQTWQERAYRSLGESRGWGSDPLTAFRQLVPSDLPPEHFSSDPLQRQHGADSLSAEEWAEFDRGGRAIRNKYMSRPLPTPYEHPHLYRVMEMTFDAVIGASVFQGKPLDPLPLIATLPRGDVSAQILTEPETDVPIVFFEQGLFLYLQHFAILLSWALPPFSPEQFEESALARLPTRHTMPPQASGAFAGTLYGYVVSGSPIGERVPIQVFPGNQLLAAMVLTYMERFIMAHELSHVLSARSDPPPGSESDREQEFSADEAGADVAMDLAVEGLGSWVVGYWACDLALTAIDLLERALGLLAFGHFHLRFVSPTHPPGSERRARLRRRTASLAPQFSPQSLEAANHLLAMSDALLGRLWEFTAPALLFARSQRAATPSPLWNRRIERDYKAVPPPTSESKTVS